MNIEAFPMFFYREMRFFFLFQFAMFRRLLSFIFILTQCTIATVFTIFFLSLFFNLIFFLSFFVIYTFSLYIYFSFFLFPSETLVTRYFYLRLINVRLSFSIFFVRQFPLSFLKLVLPLCGGYPLALSFYPFSSRHISP